MADWIEFVLDVLKISIPALIVYLTATRLLGRHLQSMENIQRLQNKKELSADTLPLRLGAYERLSMFCERISLGNLLLRLRENDQTAGELKLSLYLAIQDEYEHNISQQVYMSQQLWDIIRQARDNTLQAIESVSDIVDPQMPSRELSKALLAQAADSSNRSLAVALSAIKAEASLLFD